MPGTYLCVVQVVKRKRYFVRESRLVCFTGVLGSFAGLLNL
jgi:hypothetical protein